ncbi:hypothetical protein BS329_15510 [Amycolatopsis coloradensis]|uniref:Uncharacterized protein n=1 Tax=Amycolatopsis coloradensis TaxID=76021 RepID=A0A1R0KU87_9PSEU|nr:hypothetical protein [Amycolatopsis coloradensis]OLZ51670.1 hypothetical protein BS329_15510 [Amycolatopsis coloradensis]
MDTKPNWGPAKLSVPDLLPDLMCMETVTSDGVEITRYKHIDTRRSIHLDANGTAYNVEFRDGAPLATKIPLADAVSYLRS